MGRVKATDVGDSSGDTTFTSVVQRVKEALHGVFLNIDTEFRTIIAKTQSPQLVFNRTANPLLNFSLLQFSILTTLVAVVCVVMALVRIKRRAKSAKAPVKLFLQVDPDPTTVEESVNCNTEPPAPR